MDATVRRYRFTGGRVEDGYAYIGGGFSNFHLTIADVGAGSGSPGNPIAVATTTPAETVYMVCRRWTNTCMSPHIQSMGVVRLEVFDVDAASWAGLPRTLNSLQHITSIQPGNYG